MTMKIEKILQGLTVVPLYLAVLLVPLFFVPLLSGFLEWHKYYLLVLLTAISLVAWLANGVFSKKLTIYRSPFELPLALWWVATLVASLLSKDAVVSFLGARENASWGFIGLTVYVALTFLILWNIRGNRVERFLTCMGIGGGLVAVYFWLASFGLWKTVPFPQSNPIASLNTPFALFLVLVLGLGLGYLLLAKTSGRRSLVWGIIAALCFVTITAIGFTPVWIGVAVMSLLLLLLAFTRLEEVRYPVVSIVMALFVLSIVFTVIGTPQFLMVRTPVEVSLNHGRSARIAADTLKEGVQRLFLGSGLGTFVYDFSAHRREDFNGSPAWNVRFARPVATSYQILAETGILGSVAFLAFVIMGVVIVVRAWLKKRSPARQNSESVGLFFTVAVVWLASIFFLFRVVFGSSLWLFFFAGAALMAILAERAGFLSERVVTISLKGTPKASLLSSFVYIIVMAAVVVGGIFLGRFYIGQALVVRAARASQLNQFEKSEAALLRAVALDPYQSAYQIQIAQTFLRHAAVESRAEKPNAELIGKFVGNSINASRRATAISPLSVGAWEQLAEIYRNTRLLSKEANGWVITSLGEAIRLENTNPRLYLVRGSAYLFDNKNTEARADYEKAISLKNNYATAHYRLSLMKESEKDIDGAIVSAEAAARFAPRDLGASYNLGRLLYNRNKEGDFLRAEQMFRRILAVNRDHANTLYSLGLLLERKNELREAREMYERVLELDPNNNDVKERLAKLPEGTPRAVPSSPVREEEVSEESSEE